MKSYSNNQRLVSSDSFYNTCMSRDRMLYASSKDLIFRTVSVAIDDLEIEIGANMLNGINVFFDECCDSLLLGFASSAGITRAADMNNWLITPHTTCAPPPLPPVISLESLTIEKVTLVVLCSFVLDEMHMRSDLLRMGLRIMMVSSRLELKGAALQLSNEVFEAVRGSVPTFLVTWQDISCTLLLLYWATARLLTYHAFQLTWAETQSV
eukprot:GHVS01000249.1.p1 GENE.GHVS01000249.1~~GHVS01000249.1.p1  ORF type:complete len:210 (-),score=21.61 GHVS01000249.1:34-663(-)